MKKPFLHSLAAALYIVLIVFLMNFVTSVLPGKTIFIPMAMLGLFVLSAAVMGFLFIYEPLNLYMEGKKKEAVNFFAKTLLIFACFVIIFLLALFFM